MKNIYNVAILVLCTNEKQYLQDCLSSLINQTYKNTTIFLLDNNSTDGSVEMVKQQYKQVKIIKLKSNVGYAKANNIGLNKVFKSNFDFALILNSDIKADIIMVEQLVRTFKNNSNIKIGLIQPTILLFNKKQYINSIGNAIHYLGFGYCKDYLNKWNKNTTDKQITSASGAAMLISRKYYKEVGGFDEDFFIYNEDQNLSHRGLMFGYHHYLSVKAILYHKYNFKRHSFKMYHSEKNRLMILLENYELKTLLILFPILIMNELLLLIYSVISGWFISKMKSYYYIIKNYSFIIKKRKKIQKNRIISDTEIWKQFESELNFEGMNKTLQNLINPFYKGYYYFVSIFINL